MVALLRGHDKVEIESPRALVGILALPLLRVGWIHAVDKLLVHQSTNVTI
jgi:hypothetical protein